MTDRQVIQSVGDVVTRDLRARYPSVSVFFFAPRGWDVMRVHIVDRQDKTGRTGRLFEVGSLQTISTMTATVIAAELERRIEHHIVEYLQMMQSRRA